MFRNLVEFSSLRGHVPPRVHIEAHFPAMLGLVDALVGLLDDSAVRYSSKATCAPTVASNFFSIYLSLYVSSCLSRCLFRSLSFSLYGAVSLFFYVRICFHVSLFCPSHSPHPYAQLGAALQNRVGYRPCPERATISGWPRSPLSPSRSCLSSWRAPPLWRTWRKRVAGTPL